MKPPSTGQLARVRTRHWLVGAVDPSVHGTLVKLSCVDDDAQGEQVEVVWEVELDAVILDGEAWDKLGKRDFDRPEYFAAYLNTLRWNCVTSTNEKLFQAPFRAGIRIEAYQLQNPFLKRRDPITGVRSYFTKLLCGDKCSEVPF